MSLVSRLVQGTSFAQFTDFVSPAFFQMLPARQLFVQGRALVSSYRDAAAFADALGQRREALAKTDLAVTIGPPVHEGRLGAAPPETQRELGETVLALAFHQLATPVPTLLDLGRRRFTQRDGALVWSAGAGHVRWDDAFRRAVYDTYRALYAAGDLTAALSPLGLASAADLFARHFGADGLVTFRVESFVEAFHEIFVHCRDQGVTLHPNFLPLGLYLASLYDTLEELSVPLDVRAAFARGTR